MPTIHKSTPNLNDTNVELMTLWQWKMACVQVESSTYC